MKINWKILIPSIVVVVAIFWMVDSVRTRSYSGTNLNFGIGNGSVTVTNTSSDPVPVQLVGTGTVSFSVSSNTSGLSGPSVRQTNKPNIVSQLFEFKAPPGVSIFAVSRGSNISFVTDLAATLAVTVQPLNSGDATVTILLAVLVILGSLFYISRLTQHSWLNRFRRKETLTQTSERQAERESFKRRFDRASSENKS